MKPRLCKECGADISSRRRNAKFCKMCSLKIKRGMALDRANKVVDIIDFFIDKYQCKNVDELYKKVIR